MVFLETELPGLFLIDMEPNVDARGSFSRTFCRREFADHGLHADFVQCNISRNGLRGTLRGMHYRRPPHQESKLVRCSAGAIYDVAVDLRSDSPTFGRHFGIELTAKSQQMLYVPVGFAHGFITLCDDSEVFYQMGDYHKADQSLGFRWNDPAIGITWPEQPRLVLERDANYRDIDLARLRREASIGNG